MEQEHDKRYVPLIYVTLMLATIVAFGQVRRNDFINLDDDKYVTENPQVKAGITRQSVYWAFTSSHAANWHPLTWLSHMLDCQLFGLDPAWHHLTNLAFHIANTLLLFWLLKKMTGALWQSAFVAAAFGLHPLHVESVAWIAERKDVLSGLFWILTIAAYVRYTQRPNIASYLLVVLAFVLGLMAKPMLVTLPFVLLLLDYWPLGRFEPGSSIVPHPSSIVHRVWEKVPFFALSAVSCVVTFIVQQSWQALAPIPLKWRIINVLTSYLMYIERIIWPTRLAVFYPYCLFGVSMWELTAAVVLLSLVSVRVINYAQSHKYLPVGWLWYLGTLVPVIGLVQVGEQAMADRYTYLPSIGIFIIVAWGASELLGSRPYRKVVLATAAAAILAALLICTRMQLKYWRNSFTLYEHALAVTENNYKVHSSYGVALAKNGRFDEALMHLREAQRIVPQSLKVRKNMGDVLGMIGGFDEAIACFNEVLRTRTDWPDIYHNLGSVYAKQGKFDEAIQNYNKALQLKPDYLSAHLNLAQVFLIEGNIDKAIWHCRQALQINPDDVQARHILKKALAGRNKTEKQNQKGDKRKGETVSP